MADDLNLNINVTANASVLASVMEQAKALIASAAASIKASVAGIPDATAAAVSGMQETLAALSPAILDQRAAVIGLRNELNALNTERAATTRFIDEQNGMQNIGNSVLEYSNELDQRAIALREQLAGARELLNDSLIQEYALRTAIASVPPPSAVDTGLSGVRSLLAEEEGAGGIAPSVAAAPVSTEDTHIAAIQSLIDEPTREEREGAAGADAGAGGGTEQLEAVTAVTEAHTLATDADTEALQRSDEELAKHDAVTAEATQSARAHTTATEGETAAARQASPVYVALEAAKRKVSAADADLAQWNERLEASGAADIEIVNGQAIASENLARAKAELAAAAQAANVATVGEGESLTMLGGKARVVAGEFEGSTSAMAFGLARVASASKALAPVIDAVFPLFLAGAFADILFSVGEKMYTFYQNTVNAREELAEFARVEKDVASASEEMSKKVEQSYIAFLELVDPAEAARERLRSLGSEEFKFKLPDDKQLKDFPGDFTRFVKQLFDVPANDVETQMHRIAGSIEYLQSKLNAPVLRGTLSREELQEQLDLLKNIQTAMQSFADANALEQRAGTVKLGQIEEGDKSKSDLPKFREELAAKEAAFTGSRLAMLRMEEDFWASLISTGEVKSKDLVAVQAEASRAIVAYKSEEMSEVHRLGTQYEEETKKTVTEERRSLSEETEFFSREEERRVTEHARSVDTQIRDWEHYYATVAKMSEDGIREDLSKSLAAANEKARLATESVSRGGPLGGGRAVANIAIQENRAKEEADAYETAFEREQARIQGEMDNVLAASKAPESAPVAVKLAELDPGQLEKYTLLWKELQAEVAKFNLEMQKMGSIAPEAIKKATADMEGTIGKIFQPVERSMEQLTTGVLRGTTNISTAFKRMGGDIILATIDALQKSLIHYAVHELAVLALHLAGQKAQTAATGAGTLARAALEDLNLAKAIVRNLIHLLLHGHLEAAKTAATATADAIKVGAATATEAAITTNLAVNLGIRKAETTLANSSLILGSGGVGFAAAFASVMAALPFPVNVATAPGVAGATLSTILGTGLAFNAAEGGAEVTKDQLMKVHENELVLPAGISGGLKGLINRGDAEESGGGRGSSGNGVSSAASRGGTIGNTHISINALDSQSIQDFLGRNRQQFTKMVKQQVRNGALVRR